MNNIPENIDFGYAQQFKREIADLLSDTKSATLDLSHVQRISTTSLQLLVCAYTKAQKEGINLHITASDALRDALLDLDLGFVLDKEENSG